MQNEEDRLKNAEEQSDEIEQRISELESRRDYLLQQKQAEIDESEKSDKLKEEVSVAEAESLQSTAAAKRDFAHM